jgi:hypothetical protein
MGDLSRVPIVMARRLYTCEDFGLELERTARRVETPFDRVFTFSQNRKFRNYTHPHEAGGSVLEAVKEGGIDQGAHKSYRKMEREKDHLEWSVAERRKKDKGRHPIVISRTHKISPLYDHETHEKYEAAFFRTPLSQTLRKPR